MRWLGATSDGDERPFEERPPESSDLGRSDLGRSDECHPVPGYADGILPPDARPHAANCRQGHLGVPQIPPMQIVFVQHGRLAQLCPK